MPILGILASSKSGNLVPSAPTIGTVTVTNSTTVSIPFTAGSSPTPITSYVATSSPSIALTVSGTTSPLTVTGAFASNTAYTFQIAAVNATGTGAYSSASNSITPAPLVAPSTVQYLVVGGGGGSSGGFGGGAGGGGYRTGSLGVSAGVGYTVTVGAGGTGPGVTLATGSVFSSITSLPGEFGNTSGNGNQTSGVYGSGAGCAPGNWTGGVGTSGQGNLGGNSDGANGSGAGGAGAAGQSAAAGGAGGNGSTFSINGGTYAGGGGGAATDSRTTNNGGSGGGGNGGSFAVGRAAGTNGSVNTGGGAGGGTQGNQTIYYTSGGSGIVIVAYSSSFTDAVSTTGSPSYVNNGTNKIYTFTGSGSITF
jgi:hypothetical protein